jgi:hypothetical protein
LQSCVFFEETEEPDQYHAKKSLGKDNRDILRGGLSLLASCRRLFPASSLLSSSDIHFLSYLLMLSM